MNPTDSEKLDQLERTQATLFKARRETYLVNGEHFQCAADDAYSLSYTILHTAARARGASEGAGREIPRSA